MRVCLQATRLRGPDHVVLSVATTTLQRWKVEVEVCTRKAESYCVQLTVPPATVVAPSRPANSTQQSGQAPHWSSPILNGNLPPRPQQVFDLQAAQNLVAIIWSLELGGDCLEPSGNGKNGGKELVASCQPQGAVQSRALVR